MWCYCEKNDQHSHGQQCQQYQQKEASLPAQIIEHQNYHNIRRICDVE